MTTTFEQPRGMRRGAAIATAIGSVAAVWWLSFARFGGTSGAGETTFRDGMSVEYTYGGDTGLDVTGTLLGLTLAAAALTLWAAGDRRLVLAAWATCAIAVGATIAVALDRRSGGLVTSSEIRALESGMSRSAVLERLGEPAGTATAGGPGSAGVDCVVYLRGMREHHEAQPLCFRGGRLISPELRS